MIDTTQWSLKLSNGLIINLITFYNQHNFMNIKLTFHNYTSYKIQL